MADAYEFAIIGGGVVGLATACALQQRGAASILVLEAEPDVASHQTGHNSGVIHSGIYYRPGSLKARLCVRGQRALYDFCRNHAIAHRQCGKLIVATNQQECKKLEELALRAQANGLIGVERLDAHGLQQHEPHVAGIAGLFVPETGVVNFANVSRVLANEITGQGGRILNDHVVQTCREVNGLVYIESGVERFDARHVVCCAGLQAERLARRCGIDPGVRLVPFRGEYCTLSERAASLVNGLIYPVPDPRWPFLGVHLTRGIEGRVEAGPNAVLSLHRSRYERWACSMCDALDMLSYPGFRSLARRSWRFGLSEFAQSCSARLMTSAIRRLLPKVAEDDIERGRVGIRAQAVRSDGTTVDDFHMIRHGRITHIINAPSPAATASLAIGQFVAQRITSD